MWGVLQRGLFRKNLPQTALSTSCCWLCTEIDIWRWSCCQLTPPLAARTPSIRSLKRRTCRHWIFNKTSPCCLYDITPHAFLQVFILANICTTITLVSNSSPAPFPSDHSFSLCHMNLRWMSTNGQKSLSRFVVSRLKQRSAWGRRNHILSFTGSTGVALSSCSGFTVGCHRHANCCSCF